MKENLFDKIMVIVLTLLIIISSLYVGNSVNENMQVLEIIISIIGIIYIICKKIRKEDFRIIKNKLDIFVLILCISPIIPIVFNSYVSLEGAVLTFFRYVCAFNIYILIKNLNIDNKKIVNVIQNIIIFCIVLICFLGLDNIMSNYFVSKLYDIFGWIKTTNQVGRMISIIGYSNTLALLTYIGIILCIGLFINKRNAKYKYIYIACSFVFMACGLLASSIAALLCFGLISLVLVIIQKNSRIEIMQVLLSSGILGLIYMQLTETLIRQNEYMLVWGLLIAFSVINIIITMLINKIICNKNIMKKSFIALVMLVILSIIAVGVGMNLTKPLQIFNIGDKNTNVRYYIYDLNDSREYKFEFDIDAHTTQNRDIFLIEIEEKNKYIDTICKHSIEFGNFTGKKELSFKLKNETVSIRVNFVSTSSRYQNGLKVNRLMVNEKELALDYLYLPTFLVDKVKGLINANLNSRSVFERLAFMDDALELTKGNLLTGIGRRWLEILLP